MEKQLGLSQGDRNGEMTILGDCKPKYHCIVKLISMTTFHVKGRVFICNVCNYHCDYCSF